MSSPNLVRRRVVVGDKRSNIHMTMENAKPNTGLHWHRHMTTRPERSVSSRYTLIEPVYPMPPPGKPRDCYSQSCSLMFKLRKDPSVCADAAFVGFKQPRGYGAHFVVEDAHSVYDQTQRIEGQPEITRLTKESYWEAYDEPPVILVRFGNDKFDVLQAILCAMNDLKNHPQTVDRILAIMLVVDGVWDKGPLDETKKARLLRVSRKIFEKVGSVKIA